MDITTLVGYVDALIQDREIPSWDDALGLYVLGRPDPRIRQLENAIVAQRRESQLRIISVDSLLSLAEVMNGWDIDHEGILAVLRPSGPRVDPIVELMTVLLAQPRPTPEREVQLEPEPVPDAMHLGKPQLLRESRTDQGPMQELTGQDVNYWLTPLRSVPDLSAEDCVRKLVGRERIYAFGERTPGRKDVGPGDQICFYVSGGVGIVAHATIATAPEYRPDPRIHDCETWPWTFALRDTHVYLDNPNVLDSDLRAQLDVFEGRDPDGLWGWFVQSMRKLSQHDFRILTHQKKTGGAS